MEDIIGLVHEVSGHTYDILYDLYFTTDRVIAVILQNPNEVSNIQSSVGWQNLIFGNWINKRKEKVEQDNLYRERRRNLKGKTPEELAVSHPLNIIINYDRVDLVELRNGFFETQLKFTILTANGQKRKIPFNLTRQRLNEARTLLEKAPLSTRIRKYG